ncbi:MAG: aminoacyl-histidine dipeptidase [Treponema sp.]|nr:aminoacyl-histidine dipeptidase [Treponema sp.]
MLAGQHEPTNALKYFEKISQIPRGSGNEKGISDYLVAFAKERGLWVHQDKALNVIIKKPGTKGYENARAIILQGHMDMVCEKNADTMHDFLKDPIKLVVDGDSLKADGTTLGADNGAAVALSLALLDSFDIPHPPLEVLITTREEVGLLGAAEVDGGLFDGRLLLNMDSGEEGFFIVSCAGGGRVDLSYPLEYCDLPAGYAVKTLKVKGLKGGHSGVDITKERGNSNRLLGRALRILRSKFAVQFCGINGGSKENAIPREAEAVIAFADAEAGELADEVKQIEKTFKREYAMSDEAVEICLEDCTGDVKKVFTQSLCDKIVSALLMLPNGVQAMSLALEDLPETSLNIGVVTTMEDEVVVASGIRSSVGSRKDMLVDQINVIAEVTGASVRVSGTYPAWEYNEKSVLREQAMRVFEQMSGKKAVIRGTHGGLECGIFCEKISGVDIVSFGPDIHEMHTPNERMSISSFGRTWDFLCRLLVALAG